MLMDVDGLLMEVNVCWWLSYANKHGLIDIDRCIRQLDVGHPGDGFHGGKYVEQWSNVDSRMRL